MYGYSIQSIIAFLARYLVKIFSVLKIYIHEPLLHKQFFFSNVYNTDSALSLLNSPLSQLNSAQNYIELIIIIIIIISLFTHCNTVNGMTMVHI